jgi:ribosomal protein L11 methyltransferase
MDPPLQRRSSPSGGEEGGWRALVLVVPAPLADEITGRLAGLILGAEHRPAEPDSTRMRLFLGAPGQAGEALETAREILAGFGLEAEDCGLGLERIEDERWVERYQSALRPIPLGRRFVVLPGGSGEPTPGREPIRLTPGRAFGTGDHATTRLCAEELERHVAEESRWVDLGCGTAILSIDALRCGAAELLAVDQDGEAVDVAGEVLEANGLAGRVRVRRGSIEETGGQAWSGIVANIHAPFFIESAEAIGAALEPGGLLIASGFVTEQVDEIAVALERAGLREIERRSGGPWVVWVGRRERAGGR